MAEGVSGEELNSSLIEDEADLTNYSYAKVLMTGDAESAKEAFDFKVGEWVDGIGLMVRHAGYGEPRETAAGIWPSVEQRRISLIRWLNVCLDRSRLVGPESISWTEVSD
jgi:hypothetical protein